METVTTALLVAGVGIIGLTLIVIGIRGSVKIWREDKNGIQDR
jgi:hypothetical protein